MGDPRRSAARANIKLFLREKRNQGETIERIVECRKQCIMSSSAAARARKFTPECIDAVMVTVPVEVTSVSEPHDQDVTPVSLPDNDDVAHVDPHESYDFHETPTVLSKRPLHELRCEQQHGETSNNMVAGSEPEIENANNDKNCDYDNESDGNDNDNDKKDDDDDADDGGNHDSSCAPLALEQQTVAVSSEPTVHRDSPDITPQSPDVHPPPQSAPKEPKPGHPKAKVSWAVEDDQHEHDFSNGAVSAASALKESKGDGKVSSQKENKKDATMSAQKGNKKDATMSAQKGSTIDGKVSAQKENKKNGKVNAQKGSKSDGKVSAQTENKKDGKGQGQGNKRVGKGESGTKKGIFGAMGLKREAVRRMSTDSESDPEVPYEGANSVATPHNARAIANRHSYAEFFNSAEEASDKKKVDFNIAALGGS